MTRSPSIPPALLAELHAELTALLALYRDAAAKVGAQNSTGARESPEQFARTMQTYASWLVFKVCAEIAFSDRRWTAQERALLHELVRFLEPERLADQPVAAVLAALAQQLETVSLASLLLPFCKLKPLREMAPLVEAHAMRIANLVTKLDGAVSAEEVGRLRSLQFELQRHLDRPIPLAEQEAVDVALDHELPGPTPPPSLPRPKPIEPAVTLAAALQELDSLVGLTQLKQDVRELVNFLTIQQARVQRGLGAAP